jgi:hypothetical protein
MADYKGIQGYSWQKGAADPTNTAAGQVWYNSTTGKFKIATQGAAGWSTGGNLNTTRSITGGAGLQTAALAMGGNGPPTVNLALVEEYNGSSWTEITAMPQAFHSGGSAGITTAAACWAGGPFPVPSGLPALPLKNQEYNGSSWSEGTDINTGRWGGATWGVVVPACGYVGGESPVSGQIVHSEEYDGSTWTEGSNLNSGRRYFTGVGPQTAAIVAFGTTPGPAGGQTAYAETYNGTAWTASTATPYVNMAAGSGSQGTQTAAFFFAGAGAPDSDTGCVIWNGSSWAATPLMATSRGTLLEMAGTSASALAFGGDPSITTTEEYSDPAPIETKTVTTS